MANDFDTDLVVRDVPIAISLLKDVKAQVSDASKTVKTLLTKVKDGEFANSEGISLLDLKCHLLLNYLINLTYISLKKAYGRQIEGDDAILRLTELRTVLEKIRPFEQKLKYHIDKVIKTASGCANSSDPLRFSANPNNLINKEDIREGEDEDSEDNDKNTGKAYVPPKLLAMHYDENKPHKEELIVEARRRAISSSIIQELKAEYYDGPEEVKEYSYSTKSAEIKEMKQRQQYEESYFVRLNPTKEEKRRARKKMQSELNDLTHFGDISALTNDADEYEPHKKRKKSKKFKRPHKKRR